MRQRQIRMLREAFPYNKFTYDALRYTCTRVRRVPLNFKLKFYTRKNTAKETFRGHRNRAQTSASEVPVPVAPHVAEKRDGGCSWARGQRGVLVAMEIYHRLPRETWSRIKHARSRAGRALARGTDGEGRRGGERTGARGPRREENRVTARSRVAATCSCAAGEGGLRPINHGRILRFCRTSRSTCVPRAPLFRGPNRSRNGVRTVVRRGRVPVIRETSARTAGYILPGSIRLTKAGPRLHRETETSFV